MSDHVDQFIAALSVSGCAPSRQNEIIADDKRRRFALAGDKPKTKNGSYQLRISGDFAVGRWTNFRTGESGSWHSKSSRSWSADDRASHKARIDADRALAGIARLDEQRMAAEKARRLWDSSGKEGTTPYIDRKKSALNGARIRGQTLVICGYYQGKISTLQFIQPDGSKRFLIGSKKNGAYFPIAEPDDRKETIFICEGFATGDAIRKATGFPVIVAFDAGNLWPVALEIRARYPESRIVFAGDDDQWTLAQKYMQRLGNPDWKSLAGDDPRWQEWRCRGFLVNAGRKYALEAAGSIENSDVIFPGISEDEPGKKTDFNDLFVAEGLDIVKNRILPVLKARAEKAPAGTPSQSPVDNEKGLHLGGGDLSPSESWQDLVEWKQGHKGEKFIHPDKSVNYGILIQHLLRGIFAWDEFQLMVIVKKCPPWGDSQKFRVHELCDNDLIECDYWLQKRGLNGSESKTKSAIYRAALINPVHPARDYFKSLKWDNVARLDNWLIDICGAEKDDPEYLKAVGSKWVIAAVKRVHEPGCQFDHMLILEGPQAKYKSTTLRELATFGDKGMEEEYFTEGFKLKNHENKDELLKLWGCLIVEIGEMADFKAANTDALKNFITTRSDKIRIPYAKLPQVFKRQFIFAGTRNPVGGLFKDPTGARRFWPVSVGQIDIERLRRDKAQIWAEAVHRYHAGETLQLSDDLYSKCAAAADMRGDFDVWTDDVSEKVRNRDFVTVREIAQEMGIPVINRAGREQSRIQNILKTIGFEYGRKSVGGRQIYGWKRTLNLDDEEEIKW